MAKRRSNKYDQLLTRILRGEPLDPVDADFIKKLEKGGKGYKSLLDALMQTGGAASAKNVPSREDAFRALGLKAGEPIGSGPIGGRPGFSPAPDVEGWQVGAGGGGGAGRAAEDAFLSQIERDPSTLNMNEQAVLRREADDLARAGRPRERARSRLEAVEATKRSVYARRDARIAGEMRRGPVALDAEGMGTAQLSDSGLGDVIPDNVHEWENEQDWKEFGKKKMGGAPGAKAAKGGGKWGKIAKGAGKFWWALPFALEGAGYVKDAVKKGFGVGERFFDGKSALDEFLGEKRQEQAYDDHQRKRAEALQQLKMQNRMRMMQVAPHLAQSLLAGRELPEDAVVIGGKPRVDLLDQVAEGMSAGAFQQGM